VSATRTQADWQSDLAALSQDILHWQQSQQRWWCGDFNARIGRQGAEANAITSPNSEVTKDAQGASLVETLSECMFSLTGQAQTQNILATARKACQLWTTCWPRWVPEVLSTMKHWFVDDDSDALMRITVPGHLKTRAAA
jgi:hypothetical protein